MKSRRRRPSFGLLNPFTATAEQIRLCNFIDSGGQPERFFTSCDAALLRAAVAWERAETDPGDRRALADRLRITRVRPFLKFKPIIAITTRSARWSDLVFCRQLLEVIGRLQQPPLPAPREAKGKVMKFPRRIDDYGPDDTDWRDAVARQGVQLPHGAEYYGSTHWQLVTAEMKRGRCSECGAAGSTQLHHLNDHSFGQERPEDVSEVCWRCHARTHGAGLWRNWKKAA
jgi:hypothetical protein